MNVNRRIGLVVVVKDEVHDIAGWLAWHLAVGFHTIFVFDDHSTDGTDQVVKSAAALFDIRYVKLAQDCDHFYDRQQNAYKKMLLSAHEQFSWLCFLDADEYLLLRKDDTVSDFVARYPDAYGIAINWCLYGSNDQILRPLLPSPLAYMRHSNAAERINRHVKSFVRPDRVDVKVEGGMHNVHCFRVDARSYVDTNGVPIDWSMTPGIIDGHPVWDTALIMHFQCRSMEHFLDRSRKRRDVHIDVRSWINQDWNKENDHPCDQFSRRMFEILTQTEIQNSRTLCRLIGSLSPESRSGRSEQAILPKVHPALSVTTVLSCFGTTLHIDAATDLLVHAPLDHGEAVQPVFLVTSSVEPSNVVLVRPIETGTALRLESNRQAVVVVALHLAASGSDEITLQTPATRLFLTAAPPTPAAVGEIRVTTRHAKDWEKFRRIDADGTVLDEPVRRMLEAYFSLLSEQLTVERLANWLSAHPLSVTSPLLQILLRQLPRSQTLRLSSLLSGVVTPELLSGSQYS